MPLRTWWLRTRLDGLERKLKRLRTRQRHLRQEESDLAKAKKQGLAPEEAARREAKLHQQREALTREVNAAIVEEERLKQELKSSSAAHPSSS